MLPNMTRPNFATCSTMAKPRCAPDSSATGPLAKVTPAATHPAHDSVHFFIGFGNVRNRRRQEFDASPSFFDRSIYKLQVILYVNNLHIFLVEI
jgi:hypothetical protein